jgi:hypothetical protein
MPFGALPRDAVAGAAILGREALASSFRRRSLEIAEVEPVGVVAAAAPLALEHVVRAGLPLVTLGAAPKVAPTDTTVRVREAAAAALARRDAEAFESAFVGDLSGDLSDELRRDFSAGARDAPTRAPPTPRTSADVFGPATPFVADLALKHELGAPIDEPEG